MIVYIDYQALFTTVHWNAITTGNPTDRGGHIYQISPHNQ